MSELPHFLFHATFRCFLDSIEEKGLLANPPQKNYKGESDDACVYLAYDEDVAKSYAECAEVEDKIFNSGIVIIRVDTSMLNLNKFGRDANLSDDEESSTIAYYDNIPPTAIMF